MGTSFAQGLQSGEQQQATKQAHKQALSDMELENHIRDLLEQKKNLQAKIPAYLDPSGKPKQGIDGNPIPEYQQLVSGLEQNARDLKNVYHPEANPTAIQRFGHLLTDHLGLTSAKDRQGKAAEKHAKDAEAAQQAAQEAVASAPIGGEQEAEINAQQAGKVWRSQADARIQFLKDNHAPQEVIDQAVVAAGEGPSRGNYRPDIQPLTLADGSTISAQWEPTSKKWQYLDGSEIPLDKMAGAKVAPKQTNKGLKYEPQTGEVVDQDTGKRYSVSDVGTGNIPPEVAKMFNDSKAMMNLKQQNALALANQRGLSFAQNRFGGFVDPDNPGQVIPVPYGEAAKRGLHLATGAQYQTMENMLKASTSGLIGNEVVAFSTALAHADLLEQAAAALDNDDTRALNNVKNQLATQFGDEAPTDFNTIAGAYTREVTKALAAGHVTDSEIAANGATIPQDASPEQILGAIKAYKNLMRSKINIRMQQIQAGMQGHPFLGAGTLPQGGTTPPPAGGGTQPPPGGKSKTGRSLAAAMALPANKGKTAAEVEKHLTDLGYTVTRP